MLLILELSSTRRSCAASPVLSVTSREAVQSVNRLPAELVCPQTAYTKLYRLHKLKRNQNKRKEKINCTGVVGNSVDEATMMPQVTDNFWQLRAA